VTLIFSDDAEHSTATGEEKSIPKAERAFDLPSINKSPISKLMFPMHPGLDREIIIAPSVPRRTISVCLQGFPG